MNEVTVVVLGDLGHSPRMVYHAQSFKKLGYHVNICGYLESSLPTFLYGDDFSIYEIPVIHNKWRLPYLIFAAYKIIIQLFKLTMLLKDVVGDETRFVIVQNPPSLPLLAILGFLKLTWAPNIQLIVDWHNLNWSILNLKYQNESHRVVKLMKWYEKWFTKRFANFNLTVTSELKRYLIDQFGLDSSKILTLYDRPSDIFQPLNDQNELKSIIEQNSNLFNDLNYDQTKDRIIVSSTSFTPDEDFQMLVNALKTLDEKLADDQKIILLVTGKGPLQNQFNDSVTSYNWKNIVIKNIWLPIEQYPNILKIADLGVSLHYSSSGLDLPMKIVDLFGSGVPVVSLNYPVINELVKNNINGVVLKENDSNEMANCIFNLLFEDRVQYLQVKEGALKESLSRWDDEWDSKLALKLSLSNKTLL